MPRAHFRPALFRFLAELGRNNRRDWFQANAERYEEDVRQPCLRFVADFGRPLEKISARFVAEPRKAGGSLFRIHRDVRFARDKSPYKTFAGIQFRHEDARDAHAPGFYLHLAPGECFAAVGTWHPDPEHARAIREAIVADPAGWKRATRGRAATGAGYALAGEALKRPPRGFDPEHPLVEDLKRKDFYLSARLGQKDVTAPDFLARYTKLARAGAPLARFLCGAVGAAF